MERTWLQGAGCCGVGCCPALSVCPPQGQCCQHHPGQTGDATKVRSNVFPYTPDSEGGHVHKRASPIWNKSTDTTEGTINVMVRKVLNTNFISLSLFCTQKPIGK